MLQRIGPMEILLVVIVALLIFGPSKLPQLGRSVGESIKEFKNSMKAVRDEVEAEESAESEEQKKG